MVQQSIDHRFTLQKLLLALLNTMSSGWIPSSHFDRLVKDFGIPDGPPEIYFLTGLTQIFREIPLTVFEDIAVRSSLLESIQSALDAAIEREELRLDSKNDEIK